VSFFSYIRRQAGEVSFTERERDLAVKEEGYRDITVNASVRIFYSIYVGAPASTGPDVSPQR
jgi:hypothetical protein